MIWAILVADFLNAGEEESMTAYALKFDGTITLVYNVHLPKKGMQGAVASALNAAGYRMSADDVVRVEVWGDPIPDCPSSSGRDGLHYTWAPGSLLARQKTAYELAGGKLDDYLRDLFDK